MFTPMSTTSIAPPKKNAAAHLPFAFRMAPAPPLR
jgi:hypothetical protein